VSEALSSELLPVLLSFVFYFDFESFLNCQCACGTRETMREWELPSDNLLNFHSQDE